MEIIIAQTAGFCFGVGNAVKIVNDLLDKTNSKIYTIGPIIHNEQVVEHLKNKGVKVIDSPDEVKKPGQVVIRAHGVVPEVYTDIASKGLDTVDATCPYVKKIHHLVSEKYSEGYKIIIIGDRDHPEVKGINGWCSNSAVILNNIEEAEALPESQEKICVVAQTTITKEKWETINNCLQKRFKNVIKFDTICNATSARQTEAMQIAQQVDLMLVIGGKRSSNTQKLFEICCKYCSNTYQIETAGELPPVDIQKIKKIGITAGASTPDWVIEEVILKMDELNKQENEMSFEEAFEKSLVVLESGSTVKGRIIGFNNNEVFVDLGYKSDGIIKMNEFTDDPDFKPESIKIGEEIEVYIIRVNDGEGSVLLSKKRVDAIKSWDIIEKAYEEKTPVKAKIISIVNGGAIASANGIRIFIPASQISNRYVKDLSEYLKKPVTVRIIEYNKQKKKLVGSQRVLMEEQKGKAESNFWNNVELNKTYTGEVKSLTNFGAFVDLGGVDGLIHISEMSWNKIKHPSEVFKIGDQVDVTIKEFDKEQKRISLGYRKEEDNPWNKAATKYSVGETVKGRVARLVPFGAFVELDDGVDGLVHISQISNARIAKPGDVLEVGQIVEAKITEMNIDAKKISLSIKEVNPIEPVKANEERQPEEASEQIPSEHKEEMSNTIGDMLEPKTEE